MKALDARERAGTRRVGKLEAIVEVARALTVERDPDALLVQVMDAAKSVVDADRCTLFLVDKDTNELWSKIAHEAKTEIRFPIGEGIAGLVAEVPIFSQATDDPSPEDVYLVLARKRYRRFVPVHNGAVRVLAPQSHPQQVVKRVP